MRQQRLSQFGLRLPVFSAQGGQLARDAVRPERRAGPRAAPAVTRPPRRSVRLTISPCSAPRSRRAALDEAGQPFRQPVIAAGLPALAVHALLHHHPLAVIGDDEAVQIEIEAVLHRGAVDLGDEPARRGQRRAVEADALADRDQLVRRLARMLAAAAADVNAELASQVA